MDYERLREMDKLPIDEARQLADELLIKSTNNPAKKTKLSRDIRSASTSAEVSRICWMSAMAGEGLSQVGSGWQKLYGQAKVKSE